MNRAAEMKSQLDPIVSRYEQKRAAILPVLRLYQEKFGYISEEIEKEVAEYLDLPPIDVREVVTFYTLLRRKPAGKISINVCRTLACHLRGKDKLLAGLESKLGIRPGQTTPDGCFTLEEVECLGACEFAPMLQRNDDYVGPLREGLIGEVLSEDLKWPEEWFFRAGETKPEHQMISKFFQTGKPHFMEEYLKEGGYEGSRQAFEKFTPEALIEEVKKSNLRGLGGAGFPAGVKWSFVPKSTGKPIYLVVNGDEGEPGTFKDRYVISHAPHLVLEGMIITCYANHIHKAYVYLRGEYQEAYDILTKAVREAKAKGFLGKNIFGKNFDLEVVIHRGAGAYIAGEETGLLESLEGKKAFPRLKPPFPAVVGLFGCPTVINNIETLSYLPFVVKLGAEKFAALGSPKNGGMRLFSVSGHVVRPGVYERPLGYKLRDLIEDAGGIREGRKLKAVVPGGLSAAVLKPEEAKVGLDFDQLKALGTMAGSAGIMVMDETTCMVEALYITMRFYAHESCGQCSPCREGTGWVEKILQRIWEGRGRQGDVETLLDLSGYMGGTTICALADGACMPLVSYLKKFRSEFDFHIHEKRCDVKQSKEAECPH